jgi:hypothetical protein
LPGRNPGRNTTAVRLGVAARNAGRRALNQKSVFRTRMTVSSSAGLPLNARTACWTLSAMRAAGRCAVLAKASRSRSSPNSSRSPLLRAGDAVGEQDQAVSGVQRRGQPG